MITLTDGTRTVVIRNPLLGDDQEIKGNAIYRRSRDHSLYGYKRTPIRTLTLRFADFNRPQVNSLLNFLKLTAGNTLTLTLDNAQIWTGRVTGGFDSVHVGHANNQFTLLFEGTTS